MYCHNLSYENTQFFDIVVNDKGFLYATSSYGIYTGCPSHLSLATTSFCPDDVPPFELLVGSDKLTPMRVIRWSDDAYITHHYAAAAPNLRDGYAGT